MNMRDCHEVHIPVGHYTDAEVTSTCGLASDKEIIGQMDDPRYFPEPGRVNAEAIWFSSGFHDECPSDIRFSLNGVLLCEWTSPGDYGERCGILTPHWRTGNQYGMLKILRISSRGTFWDSERMSGVTLQDAVGTMAHKWTLRFEVPDNVKNVDGMTLFGSKFGTYSQGILVRTFFKRTRENLR